MPWDVIRHHSGTARQPHHLLAGSGCCNTYSYSDIYLNKIHRRVDWLGFRRLVVGRLLQHPVHLELTRGHCSSLGWANVEPRCMWASSPGHFLSHWWLPEWPPSKRGRYAADYVPPPIFQTDWRLCLRVTYFVVVITNSLLCYARDENNVQCILSSRRLRFFSLQLKRWMCCCRMWVNLLEPTTGVLFSEQNIVAIRVQSWFCAKGNAAFGASRNLVTSSAQ